jgi:glycosyltransferase involved in cell wall biosynthesis
VARVVFVTTSFPAHDDDAAGHFVATEAFERAALGDDVLVLAPGCGAPMSSTHESRTSSGPVARVRVETLGGGSAFGFPGALSRLRQRPVRIVAALRFVAAARGALRRLPKTDIVVAHWLLPSAWPIAAASDAKVDAVLHGSDVRLFERLPRRARVVVLRPLLARDATFRCVSNELRDRFVRAAGSGVAAVTRVEPASISIRGVLDRPSARARFGISDRETVSVIVARLVREKRVDVALELAESNGADRIVVVGGGPLLPALKRAHPKADFVGQVPRSVALAWIRASDFVVSASREEGAPTVVREARALGVPVISVPAGDLRQWAERDDDIRLVDA